MRSVPRPVVLCVLDGWGEGPATADNAIAAANTPVWDALRAKYPHSSLDCSGLDVGLPPGQMGNSEVGHMNIGAGRAVLQDLPRIDAAIESGECVPDLGFEEHAREWDDLEGTSTASVASDERGAFVGF